MSDINTIYAFFYTYDYTNNYSTSSYALPFTPLKFVPRLSDSGSFDLTGAPIDTFLSRKRIVWDFGDNTTSEAVTAVHAYKEPGQYTVTCYLYDVNGESYYDTFQQKVNIYNYLTDSITLSAPSTQTLQLTASQLLTPVLVSRNTSWQYYETSTVNQTTVRDLPSTNNSFFATPQKRTIPTEPYKDTRTFDLTKPVTLTTFVSGAAAPNYFDQNLQNTHYGHLYPYSSTFIFASGSNGTTEFIEVSSIETTSTPVYVTLSGNSIVHTSGDNISAYFVGTSGSQLLYYKDDIGGVKSNILIGFDSNTIKPFSNTSTVGYSVSVTPNTNYSYLSITANGVDSEGTSSNLFPINNNKFNNTKIAFVVKLKDSKGFSIKGAPIFSLDDFDLRDQNNNSYNTTTDYDFGSLSALSTGGFSKLYCIPQLTITEPKRNMFLYAAISTAYGTVSGISNTFDIYPENYYNIAKKGEDIDFTAKFTEIATQPLFQDTPVLINEFLGSIFGNISSSQDSLGKVTYEKIKNFVDNNATLDYSNIEQFLSILKQFDSEEYDFGLTSIAAPVELTRLIDLLSINYSRLRGTLNQFSENFEPNGYVNDTYSVNLGNELSTSTYVVTAGVDIVAYEKYSKQYHKISTSSLSSFSVFISNATQSIDSRIKNADPLTTKQYRTSSTAYTYLSTAWSGNVDFSCSSLTYNGYYNSTLITPRHGVYANHVAGGYNVGTVFKFIGTDNVTYTRKVSASQFVASDIRILLFDSDLPPAVKPVKILGPDITASMKGNRIPLVWLAGRPSWSPYVGGSLGVIDFSQIVSDSFYVQTAENPTRQQFYESVVVGDSGSAVGAIYNNEFVLATLWYSYFYGSDYSAYLPQIDSAIQSLNTSNNIVGTYNLTSLNLTDTQSNTFNLKDYNDSWGWNLVLPTNSSFAIDTFYKFYEYVYSIEGSHTNNIINYDDPNNTLQYTQSSYTAWAEQDGIISNIISNKLYDKLNLFV